MVITEEPTNQTPDSIDVSSLPDGPGGSLPGYKALNGVAEKSSDLIGGILGEKAGATSEDFFEVMLKDTSLVGSNACVPQSGMELREMVEDNTRCTIISLLPGKMYNVALPDSDDDMTVSSRKVIIGNPIALPTIDLSLIHI